ncbi:MipA/OmpV family protein [Burkholderia ubonensis]|uniref:MipA/OmpV family protein n=1 Tax=Burkholderia ubonensis TaxID=101571 RepID=UPI0039F4D8F1
MLGDGQYNQTYFGIIPAQSARTRLGTYSPGWGIYAYAFTATWNHTWDKNWSTDVVLSATCYTNKANDSSIVQQDLGVTAFTFVKYVF